MSTDVFFLSNTDDLAEGSANLYHTVARVRAALSGTGAIAYDSGTGVFSLTAGSVDHGSIGGLSDDDHPQYVLRSILTTNGDLFTRTAGAVARLAVGGANSVLGVSGGLPAYVSQTYLDHGSISGLGDDDHTQYHTDARALTWLGTRSTDDLPVGASNKYWTAELTDDRVAALLQNGTGLTWSYDDGLGTLTPAVSLSPFTTSHLAEGSNLYYTNARADARIALQAGAANGLATLGADSKIPTSQLPALAITDTFVVSSQAAMLALSAETGDVAVRTDQNKSYILDGSDPTVLGNWQELLTPTDTVLSVNGQTGAVTLTTSHISEGSNLYFTDERVDDRVAMLLQNGTGITWSYNDGAGTLTPAVSLASFSTSNLSEGSNLYYTDERVDDRVAVLLQNGTGLSWSYNDGANTLTPTVSLASFSTSNLSEGSNLYFTDERAQDAVGTILTDSSTVDFTYNDAGGTITASVIQAALDHGSIGGLADDDHTQYALLAGRSGGQTLKGDTASGGNLTLMSTNHATKGKLLIGTSGYDEANNRLGIATASPTVPLDVRGAVNVGVDGTGHDVAFYGENSGDKFFWDQDGGTSSAGRLTLDGASELVVDGKAAFGTGTIGGTYGLSLIAAGTTFNPSFAQTAACIEFAATMNTASTFNGMYGFQMAATVSATGSSLLAEAFRAEVTAANSSGTITYLAGHDVFVNKSVSGGTVTHGAAYMASAPSSAGGTFTNYYVLFVPTVPSAATNNWNIWLRGGNSRFGDDNAKTYWGTADDANLCFDGSNFIASVAAVTSGASFVVKDAGIIVNEDGGDKDTRIEGDTQTHCFFLDASADNIGICDSTPLVRLDINGGLAIASSGSATSLTADNQAVTVGNVSHIILSSNDATATNRTFTLSNGLTDGQLLVLEWSGTNAGEIVAATNIKLSATWTPTQYDTLSLMWSTNASAWLERARSANA